MMHPLLAAGVANTLFADRSRPARPRSVKRGAATSGHRTPVAPESEVVIRRAGEADARTLVRLGSLDGNRRAGQALADAVRDDTVLVAEVDGNVEAALALDGSHAVADPFRPSALHAQLLALRAQQLGGDAPQRHADGRLVLHPRTS